MNQEYFSILLSPQICLGIPLENIEAVVQLEIDNICLVPGIAEFWYGVTNYKGSLVWVLDSDRYFQLDNKRDVLDKKITAIILKHQLEKGLKRIAIVAHKLVGITPLALDNLEEESQEFAPNLRNCCSPSLITETTSTYILNPGRLLEQLQQLALVSA